VAQVDVYFAKYSKSILISHIYEPPPYINACDCKNAKASAKWGRVFFPYSSISG